MNLNYDKIKRRLEDGGNHWTSYSDLFLVLSVVFLLLYVIANIRSGALTISQQTQLVHAKEEAENLKNQIQSYNVLKDDYLKDGASGQEVAMYHDLMDKMDLLRTEAKEKRDELNKEAQEQDTKQRELNRYQQLVKNIISANLVASGKVKKRDFMIEDRDKDIVGLNKTVQTQESEIDKNNNTITQIQTNLEKQIKEVKYAYRSKKKSKDKMERDIAAMTEASNKKIEVLQEKNSQTASQLNNTRDQLAQKNREEERMIKNFTDKEASYQGTISDLERSHRAQMVRDRAAFEKSMTELKLSEEAKLSQEQAFTASEKNKNEAYKAQLAGLNNDLEHTRSSIHEIEGKYQTSLKSLENTNKSLAGDLQASQRKLNEQRVLAESIKKNFAQAGISASVDGKTGDVVINFGDEYFDTGSADLKTGMREILMKTFPVYAKSLMQNPAISKHISGIEIVGFASPTYKGKYVDPNSLSQDNREAVNYNMDLSYQRAKSIFQEVFDTGKMQFQYQKEVLPLVKVSGRSYLASDRLSQIDKDRKPAGDGYCSVFDCKKSQRVIVKFNLKEE